jgi:sugar phosphate isomerase/epimerase
MGVSYSFNCFNHSAHLGLTPSLPAQITAAAGVGYDHIGLDVPSLLAHEAAGLTPEGLVEQLQAGGISCYEIVPLSVSDDRSAAVEAARTVRRLASIVGAQHVLSTIRADVSPAVVENLRMAVEELAEIGVAVSVEFMPTSPLPSLEAAVRLLDLVDDERLGVVIDIWHFVLSNSAWSTLEAFPTNRVGFIQLDDATADAVGTSQDDSLHRRVLPGEGVFPMQRFCDALIGKGFDGVISVEVLSRAWREQPIEDFVGATLRATQQAWPAG